MKKLTIAEQINKINKNMGLINEKNETNHSELIKRLILTGFKNEKILCEVKVTHPKERKGIDDQTHFNYYSVNLYVIGGSDSERWPNTQSIRNQNLELADKIQDYILNMMGIFVEIYTTDVPSCD